MLCVRVCVRVCVCVVPIIALGQCCLTVRSQPLESGYLGLQPHSTIAKPINAPGFSSLVCKVEVVTIACTQEAVVSSQESDTPECSHIQPHWPRPLPGPLALRSPPNCPPNRTVCLALAKPMKRQRRHHPAQGVRF